MKNMDQISYEEETIEVRPFYSERLFQALDQSYQSLKSSKKSEQNDRIMDEILMIDIVKKECLNAIQNNEVKENISFTIVKYLKIVLKNLAFFDEDKIRREINYIQTLKCLILLHPIENEKEIIECMNAIRGNLFERIFEIKEQEQNRSKVK